MKIPSRFSMTALIALAVFSAPASAGPFFHIVDNNGNPISQLEAAYPYPQASFQLDGCGLVQASLFLTLSCGTTVNGIEVSIGGAVGPSSGCGDQLVYPFAEIYSDPAVTNCYSVSVNPAGAAGQPGRTLHMTAAATAPGGLVFKRWIVHYNGFAGPTIPCQEGAASLSCTITFPSDDTVDVPYPTLIYGPPYAFGGFLPPVNPNALNIAKAGRAIPIQFSLGGDFGLGILAIGSPSFQRTSCDSSEPQSAVQDTTTAGGSSLSYDSTSNTYTYVWKTDKSWTGVCGQFVLTLNDGSPAYTLNFRFY